MSLLQEIITEAIAKNGDVPRMLRLCMVLAQRLNHEPLSTWVRHELTGYPPDVPVPDYRVFRCRNRGQFMNAAMRTVLDIPLSVLPEALQSHYEKNECRDSVGEYVDLLRKAGGQGELQIPWPVEMAFGYAGNFVHNMQCLKAWKEISSSELAGMIDQIKTRVLGFTLEIEAEAPSAGDIPGATTSVLEERVTQIFNTNITGTVQNLANGSSHVSQTAHLKIKQGNRESLLQALREQGLIDEDLGKLNAAIDADEMHQDLRLFDGAIGAWCNDMLGRATKGLVDMGVDRLSAIVFPAIATYLGAS